MGGQYLRVRGATNPKSGGGGDSPEPGPDDWGWLYEHLRTECGLSYADVARLSFPQIHCLLFKGQPPPDLVAGRGEIMDLIGQVQSLDGF